ncbi:MAG: cell wall metabolism sensor histidine kinase WalK [Lachnospiraceae bacterium]|nr:cell wall metabolism sensor histidine kinase WalK [Lachnospiraceae bacterium]
MDKLSFKMSFFHKLRWKIFMYVILIGIIPGSICIGVFFHFYERRTVNNDVVSITSEAQLLCDQIITSGYLSNPSDTSINTQFLALGNIYSGRIMVINSSLRVVKDTYNIYNDRTMVWGNVISSMRGKRQTYYDRDSRCLIITVPIVDTDTDTVEGVLLITKSSEYLNQNIRFFEDLAIYSLIVLVVAVVAAALIGSGLMVKPINELSDSLEGIDAENVTMIEERRGFTETEEIIYRFNLIIGKMKEIDDSRQEFVSNVSHELKTPLTSMKVLADSLNAMGEAPVELYKEFMEDITAEIDRETTTINDLLTLVKLDKSGVDLNISQVNLNELIEIILKRLRPIAEKQQVELVIESFRPVTVEIDEVKFSLAISNLIENGIKYNNPGGYVHVSLNSDHQYCYIRVEDSGMGIPEDSINRIFERFYRVDKSHSRQIGGTGLGLAITKNAIDMHHGQISVYSVVGEGTTFDVRVPLNFIKEQV